MSIEVHWQPVDAGDGHEWKVLVARGAEVDRVLVWIPALGVPARSYEALARELASRGVAVVVHEWRGFGSSNLRASRRVDWTYRDLLTRDIAATRAWAAREFGPDAIVGGHSLGGQLATCSLALSPGGAQALWLVASGAPYWRVFPAPLRYGLPLAYRFLDGLSRAFGTLPGRRIGFGGNEARSVIREWSRTGLTGRYDVPSMGDLQPALAALDVPVRAVLLERDWLAPRASLDFLVGRTGASSSTVRSLDDARLGAHSDHFAWMKAPRAVADALLD
ncbi:alpha/beta hydrolase family protein [Lysobacter xanthus]